MHIEPECLERIVTYRNFLDRHVNSSSSLGATENSVATMQDWKIIEHIGNQFNRLPGKQTERSIN